MKALLVSGGEVLDFEILKKLGENANYILCADKGTDYCLKIGLVPDIIVGDLDSISEDSLKIVEKKKIPIKKFPTRKNSTDTELAVDYLIEKNFKDITIFGAIGSRMDHTLANIFLLKKLKDEKVVGRIIDKYNTIYLVDTELTIYNKNDYYLSIIPITDNGVLISLEGFEYNLEKTRISFGSTLGISNSIQKSKGHIRVYEGMCLVCLSKD